MNTLTSHPATGLKGLATVPGDKSISHRALMLGVMAKGTTTIHGLLESEDVLRTARALLSLGAIIVPPKKPGGDWHVEGKGLSCLRSPRTTLDLGNSGTSARLLLGLISGHKIKATLTGDHSLSKRPMGRVIKPLTMMGARIKASTASCMPLKLMGEGGHLRSIRYELPVASAQVKSAILLAGLNAQGTTTVIEPEPTRDHTERMLKLFGQDVEIEEDKDGRRIISVTGGKKPLNPANIHVPADPSSAAFPLAAALITKESDIVIPHVMINPTRIGFYDTLKDMGANLSFENIREKSGEDVANIRVISSVLTGVDVPARRIPSMIDEIPILSVLAGFAKGKTILSGLSELRVKESDRLAATVTMLNKAGIKAQAGKDSLIIEGDGTPPPGGCSIDAGMDHRMAMTALVLGMGTIQPIEVFGTDSIKTSFPGFVVLMNTLGARITE